MLRIFLYFFSLIHLSNLDKRIIVGSATVPTNIGGHGSPTDCPNQVFHISSPKSPAGKLSTAQGFLNELNDVQYIYGYFISADVGVHGAHTLLAGGHYSLCAGGRHLIDLCFGNLA